MKMYQILNQYNNEKIETVKFSASITECSEWTGHNRNTIKRHVEKSGEFTCPIFINGKKVGKTIIR